MKDFNSMGDFEKQLHNFRLTTAEILYHMPDHPKILQSFIWQELDLAPQFPILKKFFDFWVREIEGTLHSVKLASNEIITPAKWQPIDLDLTLH